ncbi:hypothetical protein C0992_009512, partial [Termitomyces sp. T32_za158]
MSNEPSSSKVQLPSLASQRGQQPSLALQREQQQGAFAPIIERLNALSIVEHRLLANRLSSPSPSQDDADACSSPFQNQADQCQRIIDKTIKGTRSFDSFFHALKLLGLNSAEAKDHVDEVIQRIKLRRREKGKHKETTSQESSPIREGQQCPGTIKTRPPWMRKGGAMSNDKQWSQLHGPHFEPSANILKIRLTPLRQLRRIKLRRSWVSRDHLPVFWIFHLQFLRLYHILLDFRARFQQTHMLPKLGVYGKSMRRNQLLTPSSGLDKLKPILRAMWKLIIFDHYVDFDKLYATLAKGYNQQDDPKDFAAGFSLVKKDVATAKRPVRSESDWMRVFDAWAEAVCVFYPHREDELSLYRAKIVDFCRNIPNGAVIAIQFDRDTWDRYSHNPFRMDDPNELHNPFLAQLLTVTSHPQAGSKRGPSASSQPRKKVAAICHNWNLGF